MIQFSLRHAAVVMAGLLVLAAPAALSAQATASEAPVTGRVTLQDRGLAGADVELHRVTPATSGVVDRTTTEPDGSFAFRLPPVDTTGFTVFFATAEHRGVRYFGRPLHLSDPRSGYDIQVFDTTSTPSAPVRISRRDMVLMTQTDGSWEVNEIVRVTNPTDRTVVSASGLPTAEVEIPAAAAAFEAGDGESPSDQVRRMGERVLLLMPLLPGEREIFFRYRLPARPARLELAMRMPADTLNLFVRQPAPTLTVEGLAPSELLNVEGERFLQYTADPGPARLRVDWPAGGGPVSPITAAVALTILVFGVGGWAALRNRSR